MIGWLGLKPGEEIAIRHGKTHREEPAWVLTVSNVPRCVSRVIPMVTGDDASLVIDGHLRKMLAQLRAGVLPAQEDGK